jgi:lysophospholipase L1-like esterase
MAPVSRRALVASISFLLALTAAELAVRARWPPPWYRRLLAQQAEHQQLDDTQSRWGSRDRDHALPKRAGVRSVLLAGDSLTHGIGVAHDDLIFPARRRAALDAEGELERAYFGSEAETAEWRRAQRNRLRLRGAARARGTQVGLVVFPILVELSERDPFRPQVELVVDFGRANDLATRDLLPALLGCDAADLWVSPLDQHPNAAGHALAAESLAPFARELLAQGE